MSGQWSGSRWGFQGANTRGKDTLCHTMGDTSTRELQRMRVKVRKVAEIKQVREIEESRSWGTMVRRRRNPGWKLSWENIWDGTCLPELSLLGTVTEFKRKDFLIYQSLRKGEQSFQSEERLNPIWLRLRYSLLDRHVWCGGQWPRAATETLAMCLLWMEMCCKHKIYTSFQGLVQKRM